MWIRICRNYQKPSQQGAMFVRFFQTVIVNKNMFFITWLNKSSLASGTMLWYKVMPHESTVQFESISLQHNTQRVISSKSAFIFSH